MKDIKKMSEEQLTKKLDKANYRVSTIKNLIYTAIVLGMLSWVVAVGAFLMEATLVSNVFSVAGVLQSGAITGFIAMGAHFEGKCIKIEKELKLRREIAKQTMDYQNSKTHSKINENDFVNKSTSQTKDDDLTKGL